MSVLPWNRPGNSCSRINGHETAESEPRAYRWRQVAQGRYAEISLDSLVSDVCDVALVQSPAHKQLISRPDRMTGLAGRS